MTGQNVNFQKIKKDRQEGIIVKKRIISFFLSLVMSWSFFIGSVSKTAIKATSTNQEEWLWPVEGIYSMSRGYFTNNGGHYGIDITAEGIAGHNVLATKSGEIIESKNNCADFSVGNSRCSCNNGQGNYVKIRHDDGTYSRYLHLKQGSAHALGRVEQGNVIGQVWSSGDSSGPHLHFDIYNTSNIRINSNPIDARHTYSNNNHAEGNVNYIYIVCEHDYNDLGICTSTCKKEFIWQTTYDTSCAGTYTVTLNTGIYLRTDKPYAASTAKSDKIKAGTEVKVHGSVKNAHNHVWYLVAYEGVVGYTSADNLTFKSHGEQEISCTLSSPAEGATVPKSSYPVIGTVTSKYPLREVIAKIDGSEYAKVTLGDATTLDIRPSDINYLLDFSSLVPGNHTLVIKARDIHHSDWVTVCTRHFVTEGVVECEHSYTSQTTESSTCLKDGILTYTCSKCGSSYTEPIPATGYHCWGAWGITKEATCTQEGSREHRCAVCWELESETIPITNHKYGAWETIQNATCTDSGIKQRTCSVCNQEETETIPENGHNFICTIVEPKCDKQGYAEYWCDICFDFYRDAYVPAIGHQYEDGICANCGEHDPDAVIKGDLDGDGEVTAADAVLLARFLADLIELDEKQLKAADIDDDGEITSADSVILARFLAGLIEVLED